MADNVIVSNAITDSNPAIPVRTTELGTGKHVQHVLLDDGTGVAQVQDPLAKYKISDLDEAGATKYYGNLAADGSWYILSLTTTAARYAKGASAYTTAWTGRAGLTYNYFDVEF